MPLQNRVDPFGELFATPARGTLFGNRGGEFHGDDRTLGWRRWASRQWICCVLDFKDRQRDVWGRYYTELFFLDEVTAFAAGHRPCFECRRKDAEHFAALFSDKSKRAAAPAMDECFMPSGSTANQNARIAQIDTLPDGAMIALDGEAYAVRGKRLLRWTAAGYDGSRPRPRGETVEVLTPPAILKVLKRGYRPQWHPSADGLSLHRRLDGLDAVAVLRAP